MVPHVVNPPANNTLFPAVLEAIPALAIESVPKGINIPLFEDVTIGRTVTCIVSIENDPAISVTLNSNW